MEGYPDWVRVGAAFSVMYGSENNPNNKPVVYIRGEVDGLVVLARWLPRKRYWHYWVEDVLWFQFNQEHIKEIKRTFPHNKEDA